VLRRLQSAILVLLVPGVATDYGAAKVGRLQMTREDLADAECRIHLRLLQRGGRRRVRRRRLGLQLRLRSGDLVCICFHRWRLLHRQLEGVLRQ
jgi:hypothetical protein